MIKKTLYFGNPAYLSSRNGQLVIKLPEVEKGDVSPLIKEQAAKTIPIEDIGVIILDHKQITITHATLSALLANNCAIITCNDKRMPEGMLLHLAGNTLYGERFLNQINVSLPLRKQLWQQTVRAKILNQAACLHAHTTHSVATLQQLAQNVRSGDPDNMEAQAAAYYWKRLFPDEYEFVRDPKGSPPNQLLNYGYAILRAIVARGLVGSGLLPVYGIHHHNRYNAYCLADDIMEPYRPYVDHLVLSVINKGTATHELTTDMKRNLLTLPVIDVVIEGKKSPLMIAVMQTTASLAKCFNGELRKIAYPDFI